MSLRKEPRAELERLLKKARNTFLLRRSRNTVGASLTGTRLWRTRRSHARW